MRLVDLAERQFGRWYVLAPAPRGKFTTRWLCLCECGRQRIIAAQNLITGKSKSCGCYRREHTSTLHVGRDSNGKKNPRALKNIRLYGAEYLPSGDIWYKRAAGLFYSAKRRGIAVGFDSVFALAAFIKKITPTVCPVFNVPFVTRGRGFERWSPSVDKKDPTKGYVRGNLQVISVLANSMKRDASPAELRQFAQWALRSGA